MFWLDGPLMGQGRAAAAGAEDGFKEQWEGVVLLTISLRLRESGD
jgi:hypothetical protein